jgi:hypothetical protein
MDVKYKNLTQAMAVLALVIGALIVYYMQVGVGAVATGTLAGTNFSNIDATSQATLSGITTDYSSDVDTANAVVPIILGLLGLVAILLIFNIRIGGGKGKSNSGVE